MDVNLFIDYVSKFGVLGVVALIASQLYKMYKDAIEKIDIMHKEKFNVAETLYKDQVQQLKKEVDSLQSQLQEAKSTYEIIVSQLKKK